MTSTPTSPNAPTSLRFSTFACGETERREALHDLYAHPVMGRVFLPHNFEPAADAPLRIDANMQWWPGLAVADVACSPATMTRTRRDAVNDDLLLNVTLAGRRCVSHCGREAIFGDGEAVLLSGAETAVSNVSDTRFLSLRLPLRPMAAMVSGVEDRLARPLRHDAEPLWLLSRYAAMLRDREPAMAREMRHCIVTHVYDLIALALGATRDAAEITTGRGLRAARLHAIKADIESNLDRADLSAATIAARHHLPLRYLQRLFESEGTTCSDFIVGRRLARAHRMLVDPRNDDRPVSAIAFAAGFQHLSRFNQVFRTRFGITPSDMRAQAQDID